jgi:hypothetical protein
MPNQNTPNDPDMNSLSMMAMMMVFCLGVLLMLAVIPHLGLPLGIAVGVAVGIALLFAHQRFLGPGHHD